MERFKNILLVWDPVSEDREALTRAAGLAKRNGGRLTVVEVMPSLMDIFQWQYENKAAEDLELRLLANIGSRLEWLIAPYVKEGIRIKSEILIGMPFLRIIQEVLSKNYDLVIMLAEGKVGLKERLFGGTSMHLMRKCPCPVWVMKQQKGQRFQRILAAVDPDPTNEERDALNVKIMDLATSLATLEESELHVIHAWSVWGGGRLQLPKEELDQWSRKTLSAHERELGKLLKNYALKDSKHCVHLLEGNARLIIPDFVANNDVDVLIMGTVCRTGIPGFFMGNTAEDVLQQVDCSVLTVKPNKFVSPITVKD